MYDIKSTTIYLSWGRRFISALIDGIVLNIGLVVIEITINSFFGKVELFDLNLGNLEIIFGLVYFAVMDSFLQPISVGKRLVKNKLN